MTPGADGDVQKALFFALFSRDVLEDMSRVTAYNYFIDLRRWDNPSTMIIGNYFHIGEFIGV